LKDIENNQCIIIVEEEGKKGQERERKESKRVIK
jgi:hypothetical protein